MLTRNNISWINNVVFTLVVITNLTIVSLGDSFQQPIEPGSSGEYTTGTEEDQEKNAEFIISFQAIVPASQLPVFVPFSFSFEFTLIEEKEEQELLDVPIFINAYFYTLFRQIISPNAP